MKLVQYLSDGRIGAGVWADGEVFDHGYPASLALIRDGDAGLERAQQANRGGRPVAFDRLVAPLTNPGAIFGSGRTAYWIRIASRTVTGAQAYRSAVDRRGTRGDLNARRIRLNPNRSPTPERNPSSTE